MRKPVRRSLVLATLLALLLGVVGISAPTALAAQPATNTRVAGINVDATTIPQLQALMNRHRLTSVQLVQFYLHRITRAQPEAPRRDHGQSDRPSPSRAPPTRPGAAATIGRSSGSRSSSRTTSTRPACRRPPARGRSPAARPHDAFIVQQLKAAGAIIIAKANLSEWANFRSGPSSSGWSGIGGQTNMAYVLDRNPCGSSSGTGVARLGRSRDRRRRHRDGRLDRLPVRRERRRRDQADARAAGAGPAIVPISADQDTAGPIARNVTDAAVLLGAVTGVDPNGSGDRRPGRPRLHATTRSSSTSTRSRAPGSASGTRTTSTGR